MKNAIFLVSIGGLIVSGTAGAADLTLDVSVPKTAYIQWFENSSTMTNIDGDVSASFAAYTGGAATQMTNPGSKDTVFEVMCNSQVGYNVDFQSAGATGAAAGVMTHTVEGSETIGFSCGLVATTIAGATTPTISLSLDGAGNDIQSGAIALADLPLLDTAPHVYTLTSSLPSHTTVADDLLVEGTYQSVVSATVSLP